MSWRPERREARRVNVDAPTWSTLSDDSHVDDYGAQGGSDVESATGEEMDGDSESDGGEDEESESEQRLGGEGAYDEQNESEPLHEGGEAKKLMKVRETPSQSWRRCAQTSCRMLLGGLVGSTLPRFRMIRRAEAALLHRVRLPMAMGQKMRHTRCGQLKMLGQRWCMTISG